MDDCILTVFTATYNRAHLIERLYRSLLRQSRFCFEWLVVDDGSTDGTEALFSEWMREQKPFPIRYCRQENQGLIRSLNLGVSMANGIFFSKIDSDDYVTDDYIEFVLEKLKSIEGEEEIYAISGVRIDSMGKPLKGVWPKIPASIGYIDATDLQRREYDLDADMSEVWKTDVLRRYCFPVWDGEKFAPEQIVLNQIALDGYKIRWYSKPLCICEYQEGGLTKGSFDLERKNPMGYAMMYNHKLKYPNTSLSEKLRYAMQCNALAFVAGNPSYILKSNCLCLSLIMVLPGMLLSVRRRIQYRQR